MEWIKKWGIAPQKKTVSQEDLREDLDTPAVVAPAKLVDERRKEAKDEKEVTPSSEDVGLDLMAPTAEGETLSPMAAQLPTMEELAAKFRGEKPEEAPKNAMEELAEKFKAKPNIEDRLRRLHERRTGEVVATEGQVQPEKRDS